MSKRTSPKDQAERKKKEEQAQQVPRDVNRIVRLTLEVIFLIAIVVLPLMIAEGTVVVTPQLRYGTYGFLIATAIAAVVGVAWRWLQHRVVFGKYSVEGLLAQIAAERKTHEVALRTAREEGEQHGREAAERKLGGDLRAAELRVAKAERALADAQPKAKRWDEEGAALEASSAQATRLRREAEAALERAREADRKTQTLLARLGARRLSRVQQMLRLRRRRMAADAALRKVQFELAQIHERDQVTAAAVESETAPLRTRIAEGEQTISSLQTQLAALGAQLGTWQSDASEAWNQIGEHQRRAARADELMAQLIKAIEQILKVKKADRFQPQGKKSHQIDERLEALIASLAVDVDRLIQEARQELSEKHAELAKRGEAERRQLALDLRQRTNDQRELADQVKRLTEEVAGLKDLLRAAEAARTELVGNLEASSADNRRLSQELGERRRELDEAASREASLREQHAGLEQQNVALRETAKAAPLFAQIMSVLTVALESPDIEAVAEALTGLGITYDCESNSWTGDNLAEVQRALIVMGGPGARLVGAYLKRAELAASEFDIDEAEDEQVASMERASTLGDLLRELVAGAISRYSAIDWLLSLPPAERVSVVNAKQASDSFVMLVIASYLAGRRKCRFVLETDAYHQVRDKLSPMLVACVGSTLKAETHRNTRTSSRITRLRISTMFYSSAVLRAVKRAGELVARYSTGESGVVNDPYNWSIWQSVVASPPDAETEQLFTAARKSLMALWCLSPTELRELLVEAIGDDERDSIRTTGANGEKSAASVVAKLMGFDPTFALAFAPTSKKEWEAVGSRASIYSLIEMSSLTHPSRGVGGSVGGKKVNKAFDPYQAVVLAWMHGHNNDSGDKLSPYMRSHTLRIPEVNAKRVFDLGTQFFGVFAAARRERLRRMAS